MLKEELNRRRKQLIERYPVWKRMTLGNRFDELVEQFGQHEFIYTANKSYTYRDVYEKTNELAKGLLKLGIKPRDNVAVLMPNCPEFIILTFALAKIGVVKIPLNHRLKSDELAYIVKQSDAACLIAYDEEHNKDLIPVLFRDVLERKGSSEFPSLRSVVIFNETGCISFEGAENFDNLYEIGSEVSDDEFKQIQSVVKYPDEVVDMFYTSGTTGQPKAAMLTHDMLWRTAYASCVNRAFEIGRRIFVPIPFFHVYGYVEGILAVCLVGGTIIPQLRFNEIQAFQLIEQGCANDIICVPAIAEAMINNPSFKKYDFPKLRAMYCSATPTPLCLWEKIYNGFNLTEINTGYGMTEVCGATVQTEPSDLLEITAVRVGKLKPGGSSGVPEYDFHNTQYKVIDPATGVDLPSGLMGELVCRGNTVTKGYYKKPQETADAIDRDGWLRTGDLGIIHNDGYIELIGRCKDIYKINGENVSPQEIEKVIEQLPQVSRVAVVGVPDPIKGEVGAAFIELEDGQLCTETQIIQICEEKLSHFKVPKYIAFIKKEEFPITPSLKIQKFKLKERVIREFNIQ